MRIPIDWLKEYIDIKITPEKLVDKLTMSGTEVEIIKPTIDIDDKIIVGNVLKVTKHQNADRLNVAIVRVGKNKDLRIVCGGTNLEADQKVPVALIGAKIGDFEIKEAEIRGIKSHGMICSESELGISDHNTGEIMVLGSDAKIGVKIKDILGKGEVIIDADITPNRSDLLSVTGIARDLSVSLNTNFKFPEVTFKESKKKTSDFVNVKVEEVELCPRYVARVLKIGKVSESPKWIKERLEASGVRSINAVVDVTNYVMLELGQPLHAFDLDKLAVGSKQLADIVVRKAKEGEKIETLDGVKRKLAKSDLIIADKKGPIAIAGVMGGKSTEVDEKTKTIILESATFDKTTVRKTAQRLALRSESSGRFEKGIPMPLNQIAIDRASELLQKISDAEVFEGRIDVLNKWMWVQHIGLRISRIEKFLGQKISSKEAVDILNKLGFQAEIFDIVEEAKRHLGKPYKWGAKFRKDGAGAFDCGYLVDYIYSLIGQMVGHSAPQIMDYGKEIRLTDLQPGDVLFRDGTWKKVKSHERNGVSHVAMYIGNNQIIHAEDHHRVDNKWEELPKLEQKVRIDPLDLIIKDPQFLGARSLSKNLDDFIAVTVPWWRLDVTIEEDLMEEIARIYGYDKMKQTLPSGELKGLAPNKSLVIPEKAKDILVGLGFSEVYNYSFYSGKEISKSGLSDSEAIKIANPLSSDQEVMRISLIPSLLNNVYKNQNNYDELKIFEIGNTYLKSKDMPREVLHLSGVLQNIYSEGIKYSTGKDFYDAKGVVELLLSKFAIDKSQIEYKKYAKSPMKPERSAEIMIGGKSNGFFGEINDRVRDSFGIKKPLAVFDINLSKLQEIYSEQKSYTSISKYPSIKRDYSFILDDKVTAESVLKLAREIKNDFIKKIDIIDIYKGEKIGNGKKSITIRVELASSERTLKDEEADRSGELIVKRVAEKLGGFLRDEND